MSASTPESAVVISDHEYSTDESDYDSDKENENDNDNDSDSDSDSDEVEAFVDEIHAAHEELLRAQRRYNQVMGIDENGDSRMPDAPPPPPVVSEAQDMEGVEQAPPEPPAHYFNGFLQVLGPNGFYYQTRYLFTAQAAHLFCLPPP